MALELDDRQRAMLREMGVPVWLPPTVAPARAPAIDRALTSAPSPRRPETATPVAPTPATTTKFQPDLAPTADGTPTISSMGWPELALAAGQCNACALCAGRKNTTLGNHHQLQADWFVVGDPPDEDEDRLGQSFAGPVGVLLDNMLRAVGARRGGQARHGAYISNIVKCRPPHNRVAQWEEMQQCAPYLDREIAMVRPRIILAMGRLAAQWLLQEHPDQMGLPLGKQRGTVYRYRGIPVVVTYDPRALLRTSANKAKAWADLCLALETLDAQSPSVQ